jgi:hypothetical protein
MDDCGDGCEEKERRVLIVTGESESKGDGTPAREW